MNVYGYIRVSSRDQNEDRQRIALHERGVEDGFIYTDKVSGKDFDRPQYKKLVKKLKPGDLLMIQSIDRLGRNYEEVQNQWRVLTKEKEADICVLDMPLLDTRQGKDLMGTVIAILCANPVVRGAERAGVYPKAAGGGHRRRESPRRKIRPPADPAPENFRAAYAAWRAKKLTLQQAADACHMKVGTFYDQGGQTGKSPMTGAAVRLEKCTFS